MEALPASAEPKPPVHVAIIMDGNGRWAKARGLPRVAGHKRGAEAVRRTVTGAAELGIQYLYLNNEIEELDRKGVRLRVIGQRSRLQPDIVRLIEGAERRTAGNRKLNLIVALSYGGRAEIVEAARCIAEGVRAGRIDPATVDEDQFERFLYTAGIPDPDLLIRTSGEKRISNFLLWQCAYAELVFLERLWPDFTRDDLESAITEFHGRDRRYGAAR
jgi:undecaprenyl diphosphate synthase